MIQCPACKRWTYRLIRKLGRIGLMCDTCLQDGTPFERELLTSPLFQEPEGGR